mgnify:CR=1 FL=1
MMILFGSSNSKAKGMTNELLKSKEDIDSYSLMSHKGHIKSKMPNDTCWDAKKSRTNFQLVLALIIIWFAPSNHWQMGALPLT